TLIRAYYPKYLMQDSSPEPVPRTVSSYAVKSVARAAGFDVDLSVENPLQLWKREMTENKGEIAEQPLATDQSPTVLDLYDSRVHAFNRPPLGDLLEGVSTDKCEIRHSKISHYPDTDSGLDLVEAKSGDKCSKCAKGTLKTQTAVELGH